jgi:cobalt/nickel transport system permease protein
LHIPDGFLDLSIAAIFYIMSVVVVGYSILKMKKQEVNGALIGIVAAAIFAVQMLNWPIPGGTSAHFVGGALAGILLGPYAGCLAMTLVLVIQGLVFADGGLTALGANVWNMAVVNVFVGYYIYRALEKANKSVAAFAAGWLGITTAAIFTGIEVGFSSSFKYSLLTAVTVMGMWHGVLGIIEGVITAGVVTYIASMRPDIIESKAASPGKVAYGAIAVMIALSPFFAYAAELVGYSEPLENVAEMMGAEEHPIYEGILPDYTVPGLDPYIGTVISAITGVAIVMGIGYGMKRAE